MLRVGGLPRGDMQHCLEELSSIDIPDDFKLKQIRSLLRFAREVGSLVGHIKQDSGFEGDTTSYLEILCAKEDSDLIRRVSHTRVLRQDFDEKRQEWRKQRKSVSDAIGTMTARALRFEDRERKTIALYALEFYKNIMGRDSGAIRGESESTDSLVEQYRRHRSEISKIPMYADSILKMLKDIRKAVRASIKLQSDSSVFAQFLEEWWASVVQFLQQSSIVDAERNSREAMQNLKKLKGRQEENKKRERSRLLSKLDDNAGLSPVEATRLSELLAAPPSESSNTPDTVVNSSWGGSNLAGAPRPAWSRGVAGVERSSHSPEESRLRVSTAAAAAADQVGFGAGNRPPMDRRSFSRTKEAGLGGGGTPLPRNKEGGLGGGGGAGDQCYGPSPACPRRGSLQRSPVGSGGKARGALKGCMEDGGGRPSVGRRSVSASGRSSATTVRSHGSTTTSATGDGGIGGSRVSWDEGSVGTEGTADTVMDVPACSGLPREEGSSGGDDDDDDDNDVFQIADNMDLGAVDLFVCRRSNGADGVQAQMTYQDQDGLRLPPSVAETPSKRVVEKERFSAALDYFRQEQQAATAAAAATVGRMAMPRPTSPLRNTDMRNLPSPLRASTGFNVAASSNRNAFGRRGSGSTGGKIRTPTSRGSGKTVQMSRDTPSARDRLPSQLSSGGGKRLARSLSVYIPRSQKTPVGHHRSSKTPVVKSNRRVLMSPKDARKYSRGAFFG